MGRKEKGQPVMKKNMINQIFVDLGVRRLRRTIGGSLEGMEICKKRREEIYRIKVPQPTNWKQTSTNNHQVVLPGITSTVSVHMEDFKNTTTPYFRVRLCFG